MRMLQFIQNFQLFALSEPRFFVNLVAPQPLMQASGGYFITLMALVVPSV